MVKKKKTFSFQDKCAKLSFPTISFTKALFFKAIVKVPLSKAFCSSVIALWNCIYTPLTPDEVPVYLTVYNYQHILTALLWFDIFHSIIKSNYCANWKINSTTAKNLVDIIHYHVLPALCRALWVLRFTLFFPAFLTCNLFRTKVLFFSCKQCYVYFLLKQLQQLWWCLTVYTLLVCVLWCRVQGNESQQRYVDWKKTTNRSK